MWTQYSNGILYTTYIFTTVIASEELCSDLALHSYGKTLITSYAKIITRYKQKYYRKFTWEIYENLMWRSYRSFTKNIPITTVHILVSTCTVHIEHPVEEDSGDRVNEAVYVKIEIKWKLSESILGIKMTVFETQVRFYRGYPKLVFPSRLPQVGYGTLALLSQYFDITLTLLWHDFDITLT